MKQVDGTSLGTVVRTKAKEHVGHKHMSIMDHEKYVVALEAHLVQADTYKNGVDGWKMPLHVDERFREWFEIEEGLHSTCARLQRYLVSFADWDREKRALAQEELTAHRSKRDTVSLKMRAAGVFAVLAKALADHEVGVQDGGARPATSPTPMLALPAPDEQPAKFKIPQHFSYNDKASGNAWADAAFAHFDGHTAQYEALIGQHVNVDIQRGLNHSHHEMGSSFEAFPWDQQMAISHVEGIPGVLHLIRRYCSDNRSCINGWKGQRHKMQ